MTIVSDDDRGRMTIPKEFGIKKTRAIIPAGSFFVAISHQQNPRVCRLAHPQSGAHSLNHVPNHTIISTYEVFDNIPGIKE